MGRTGGTKGSKGKGVSEAEVILLDTHVVLMLVSSPQRLSKAATRAITRAEAADGVAIASISLWEIAQLIHSGRIAIAGSTERFLNQMCSRAGLSVLELTPEVAALALQVPPDFPGDPADRIITATARAHGMPLVTKDQPIQDSSLLKTIW